jgi:hypothetical protein
MVGRASAESTRGWTSAGPGPIKVRTGGWNEVKVIAVSRGDAERRAVERKGQRV